MWSWIKWRNWKKEERKGNKKEAEIIKASTIGSGCIAQISFLDQV